MRFKDKVKDNIDPTYYDRLAFIESSGNPKAQAKTSSAAGLFQFTEGTWEQTVEQMGLDYSLEDRFDPKKSREVVAELTRRNANYLKGSLDRDVSPSELYLAHFLGMGGAKNMLKAYEKDPTLSVQDVMSEAQIKANQSVFLNKDGTPKTIGDIYGWADKKMGMEVPEGLFASEQRGYDFFEDPEKLFTGENKRRPAIADNPKTKEAYEKIESTRQNLLHIRPEEDKFQNPNDNKTEVASI